MSTAQEEQESTIPAPDPTSKGTPTTNIASHPPKPEPAPMSTTEEDGLPEPALEPEPTPQPEPTPTPMLHAETVNTTMADTEQTKHLEPIA